MTVVDSALLVSLNLFLHYLEWWWSKIVRGTVREGKLFSGTVTMSLLACYYLKSRPLDARLQKADAPVVQFCLILCHELRVRLVRLAFPYPIIINRKILFNFLYLYFQLTDQYSLWSALIRSCCDFNSDLWSAMILLYMKSWTIKCKTKPV